VKLITKGIALSLAFASTATIGCGGEDADDPFGTNTLIILQRPARNEMGDIFQYTSYRAGAHIIKLSPPTADGIQTRICCDQDPAFAEADIGAFDLSFDADELEDGTMVGQMVFSAKLTASDNYGLFMMSLSTGAIEQLPTDSQRDFVYPTFLAGGKIAFVTNEAVDEVIGGQPNQQPQHMDEYERGTTTQLGFMNNDGSDMVLGPRNLSHRVFPTPLANGRVLFTQWDHLGTQNAGHLMTTNPDGSVLREVFGKEGTGITNSYLKAVEVAPGRVLAIGSSRDRTVQSGAILDIRLGEVRTLTSDESITGYAGTWRRGSVVADRNQSEENASYRILTANVPLGREPSADRVGRYYDAYPLNAKDYPDLLVTWADGPVESGVLGAAGLSADFGVYLYDSQRQTRTPILNTTENWEVSPRPLRPRTAPLPIAESLPDALAQGGALIGSMNAYDSSLTQIPAGSIYGVRVYEGFSSEEGAPMDFGTREQEGHALLGIAPLHPDGSWAAVTPANVPIHVQMIDRFGLAQVTEPVWTSGRAGESRFCGGCHESRTGNTLIQPGITQAVASGPVEMMHNVRRDLRQSTQFTRDGAIGVPWDTAVQGVFDRNGCANAGCHDGTLNGANWGVTLTEDATGMSVDFIFDLSGEPVNITLGELMITGYTKSYISMAGFMMEDLEEAGISLTPMPGSPPFRPGMVPEFEYRNSPTAAKVNPVQQYPTQDVSVRAFPGAPDAAHGGLTANDHYILGLAGDAGLNFISRENQGSY
jgi:hypothetical protein